MLVHSLVYIKHHASWQLSIQSNEASMKQWSNNEACNQIIKELRIKNQSKIKNLMCLLDFCDWNQSIFLARMNPYKHTKYKDYCSTHVHEYDNSIYFLFYGEETKTINTTNVSYSKFSSQHIYFDILYYKPIYRWGMKRFSYCS